MPPYAKKKWPSAVSAMKVGIRFSATAYGKTIVNVRHSDPEFRLVTQTYGVDFGSIKRLNPLLRTPVFTTMLPETVHVIWERGYGSGDPC